MKFSDYQNQSAKTGDKVTQQALEFLKKYEGKSRDELLATIVKIATKKRRAGELSDLEIDRFYDSIAPTLTGEQLKSLGEVVATLKAIK
ncbi:MAG: hypothetical protein IJ811_00035 [Clostridia bacterium]|nr:hypothetical protein [Clostridia bacterium]